MIAVTLSDRLIKGSFWAIGTRVISMATSIGLNGLLARLLPPDELGAYFLILSLVETLGTIVLFGMPQVAVKIIASSIATGDPGKAKAAVYKITSLATVSVVLASVLLNSGLGDWIAKNLLRSSIVIGQIKMVSMLLVTATLLKLIAEYFRGLHDIRHASIFSGTASSVVLLILMAGLWIFGGKGLNQVMDLSLFASVIVLVVSASLFLPCFGKVPEKRTISLKELMRDAWPIATMNIAVIASLQGALWMVSYTMTEQNVAVYGAVLRIVGLLTMTHGLLIAVAQSSMAELYAVKDRARLEKMARAMSTITFLVGLGALGILAAAGSQILELVFGGYYQSGYELLLIIGGFYAVGIYFGASFNLLMMTGHIRSILWVVIVVMVLRFIMALYFSRWFGLAGIAVAWGIGGVIQNISAWMQVKNRLGLFCHADFDFKFIKERFMQV